MYAIGNEFGKQQTAFSQRIIRYHNHVTTVNLSGNAIIAKHKAVFAKKKHPNIMIKQNDLTSFIWFRKHTMQKGTSLESTATVDDTELHLGRGIGTFYFPDPQAIRSFASRDSKCARRFSVPILTPVPSESIWVSCLI